MSTMDGRSIKTVTVSRKKKTTYNGLVIGDEQDEPEGEEQGDCCCWFAWRGALVNTEPVTVPILPVFLWVFAVKFTRCTAPECFVAFDGQSPAVYGTIFWTFIECSAGLLISFVAAESSRVFVDSALVLPEMTWTMRFVLNQKEIPSEAKNRNYWNIVQSKTMETWWTDYLLKIAWKYLKSYENMRAFTSRYFIYSQQKTESRHFYDQSTW